ncbi:MAG: GMC family oxidoreductase [Archangium sp.]|nr:GMC family oxidoreductase [Archangium sp.]
MNFPSGQMLNAADFASDEVIDCDVVVVGSGAGGAASAWRLSAAGLRVLILEEGRKWEATELSTKQSWAVRNLYAERGTSVAVGNVILPLPRGKTVGGSTFLNSAICFRTPDKVLKHWQSALGIEWADAAKLAPVFAEVEQAIGVVKLSEAVAKEHSLVFKRGCDALNLTGDFISRNAPGCVGCGLCQLGCPLGVKGSVDKNLIPMSLAAGAALVTCARVSTVLVENGVAKGVEAWGHLPVTEARGKKLTVRAKKVFLCAGAVSTPMMLLRQGVASTSGHVGNHLHVHLASGAGALFEHVIDQWHGATQGYYLDLEGEGAVLETYSSTPDLMAVQFEHYKKPLSRLRHIASCGVMMADTSEGTVRPGRDEGRSAMGYDVRPDDMRVLKKGLRQIGEVYFAAGAKEVVTGIVGAGPVTSLAELERLLATDVQPDQMSVYGSHPMSTCRMSATRAEGVVKPTGESWDIDNLIIADASVFPTALGVNPQVTVMTVASVIAAQQLARG